MALSEDNQQIRDHAPTLQPGDATLPLAASAAALAARLPRLALAAEDLARDLVIGTHGQKKAGSGATFWQYHNFSSGDPAADIDWRQSARSETKLFVRETERDSAVTISIWADLSRGMHYSSRRNLMSKADCATLISTALILAILRAEETVQLLFPTRANQPPDPRARQLQGRLDAVDVIEKMMEGAAFGEDDPSKVLPQLPVSIRKGRCILISDFFRPIKMIEATLNEMSARGLEGHLVQIMDPAELQFPFRGRIRFHAPDGAQSRLFGDAAAVASAYHTAMTIHQQSIKTLCKDKGWLYSCHITDDPAFDIVLPLIDYLNSDKREAR